MKIKALVKFEVDTEPTDQQIKEYVQRAVYGNSIGYGEENPFYGLDEEKVVVTEVHIMKDNLPGVWHVFKDYSKHVASSEIHPGTVLGTETKD